MHINESIASFIHMTHRTSFTWETWLHFIWGTWAHQSSYECKYCPLMEVLPPSFKWRTWLQSYEKHNFIYGRNMTSFHMRDMSSSEIIWIKVLPSSFLLKHMSSVVWQTWLRFVGSLKWYVSCAKEPYERDDILQKRHVFSHMTNLTSIHMRNMSSSECMWMKELPPSFMWRTALHSYEKYDFIYMTNITSSLWET